jgi:hypothetical protein
MMPYPLGHAAIGYYNITLMHTSIQQLKAKSQSLTIIRIRQNSSASFKVVFNTQNPLVAFLYIQNTSGPRHTFDMKH